MEHEQQNQVTEAYFITYTRNSPCSNSACQHIRDTTHYHCTWVSLITCSYSSRQKYFRVSLATKRGARTRPEPKPKNGSKRTIYWSLDCCLSSTSLHAVYDAQTFLLHDKTFPDYVPLPKVVIPYDEFSNGLYSKFYVTTVVLLIHSHFVCRKTAEQLFCLQKNTPSDAWSTIVSTQF